MDYKQLLERARKNLPEKTNQSSERFEMPKVKGHVEGNKTVIINFSQIASTLNREQEHLLKFLQRELATPAQVDGPRLIFGRKLPSSLINSKIETYAKNFVLCKVCGKPDTKIIKEGDFKFLKCAACGAKNPIKGRV
ncbi:MAG: translation initiation factor IF-2 subunit beta [archaeon]